MERMKAWKEDEESSKMHGFHYLQRHNLICCNHNTLLMRGCSIFCLRSRYTKWLYRTIKLCCLTLTIQIIYINILNERPPAICQPLVKKIPKYLLFQNHFLFQIKLQLIVSCVYNTINYNRRNISCSNLYSNSSIDNDIINTFITSPFYTVILTVMWFYSLCLYIYSFKLLILLVRPVDDLVKKLTHIYFSTVFNKSRYNTLQIEILTLDKQENSWVF